MLHFHKLSKLSTQLLVLILCFCWVCEKTVFPYQDMEAEEVVWESESEDERDVLVLEELTETDPEICHLFAFLNKQTNQYYYHSDIAALPLTFHREDFSPPPESI